MPRDGSKNLIPFPQRTKEEQKAIEDAKAYVEVGVENTYAIVSNTTLDDDVDLDDEELTVDVDGEEYIIDNVARKDNWKLILYIIYLLLVI